LDENTVLAFLGGTLPAPARSDVEGHLASCSACHDLATWAAADIANKSRAPGDERRPVIGQLEAGARVGRYQILGPVGRGGMGEVYAAYHPDLDRRIALKVVYESGADSAERRARLLREAKAIARLSHPNVVAVHDAGTFGDRVYIAMEFVDGDTVDVWLRTAKRTLREILDVFVAAGRGLAAGHAADIVHRDFKPQNVMVGKDGSVRVMDFGLARMVVDGALLTSGNHGVDRGKESAATATVTQVTQTGALLGTPAYMAPEQLAGERADARSDQYSFCVALYEATHGERPQIGAPANQPRSDAPAWLRKILLRGLDPEPAKRFEGMTSVLRAIEHGRTRPRRRALGIAGSLCAGLAVMGGWRLSHVPRFDCNPPEDRIAAAWPTERTNEPRRRAVERAVATTGKGDASDAWRRISQTLDSYVREWRTMYRETCEATHIRGEQSAEVLDRRMRCLYENLDDVRALTDVLSSVAPASVSQAVGAASSLPPIARCTDVRTLMSGVPLPRDPAVLRKVQDLKRRLNDVRALLDVGEMRRALSIADNLHATVESTGYRPLLAELLLMIARARTQLGDSGRADVEAYNALVAAQAGHDDIAAAEAATILTYLKGVIQGRSDEGGYWAKIARSMIDRGGGGNPRLRSWLEQDEGAVLFVRGDLASARDHFQRAIHIKEEALGTDHPDVAISLRALGLTLSSMGDLAGALAAHDRAFAIVSKRGGILGAVACERGETLRLLHRYAEARDMFAISLGAEQADLDASSALTGLGQLNLDTGKPVEALSPLRRALEIRERDERDPTLIAETRFALARALWASGTNRRQALTLGQAARSAYSTQHRRRELAAVQRWLSERRATQ
jgi:serine/threonine protein kinase